MKKFNLILLGFVVVLFSCTTHIEEKQNVKNDKSFSLPQKVILADLPDSLQPKTVLLANMPKPITTVVPQKGKVPFLLVTPEGEEYDLTLEPPKTKFLPILQDNDGESITDKNGNPIILGEGGISQFTNYTTDDGLPMNIILCSTKDSKGNLWFGTQGGGLSRYDGSSFTTFTTAHGLVNNIISFIYEDKKDNIWLGTDRGGISRFDGKKFINFTAEQGVLTSKIQKIQEDKAGNIWFVANDYLGQFDGTKISTFSYDFKDLGRLIHIFSDKDEYSVFLFSKAIARFDGNSFTKISDIKGIPWFQFMELTKDQYGHFWINTDNGVYWYASMNDLIIGKYVHYSQEKGLAGNWVNCSLEDKYGNLWFGTARGISKYEYATDTTDESFTTYTTQQGILHNLIMTINEDKDGVLWFGTQGGGVSRYDGRGFTNFTDFQREFGSNHIRTITEDKNGNLWFGGGGGVFFFNGKSFSTYSWTQGLNLSRAKSAFEDNTGNIWFGGEGLGLCRYNVNPDKGTETITTYTAPGLNQQCWSIRQDRNGSIWFAMRLGVGRLEGKEFTFFSPSQGLAGDNVRSMTIDQMDNKWFGTFGNGLSYFDQAGFTSFTTEQGLSHNFVLCLTADKAGNIWIGTQNGLSFLSKNKIKKLLTSGTVSRVDSEDDTRSAITITKDLFKNFTEADGLPNNYISQVVELPNNKMAVGTNRGLALFDKPSEKTEEFNTLSGLEIYNTSTGYPIQNVSTGQNALFLDSKGILWAGTRSSQTGLVRIDLNAIRKKENPLAVTLRQISINENDISWNNLNPELNALQEDDSLNFLPNITEEVTTFGKALKEAERQEMRKRYGGIKLDSINPFYPIPVNLVLPYKHNDITIHYGSDELAKPNLVKYQYILEGYNEEWSPVLKNTFATFGNIKEGNYTFKVKARYTGLAEKGANRWSEPVSYTFRVLPPWYRSWLAYIMYSMILIFVVWQINLFQKTRTRRIEREKAQERELEHAKEIEKAYHNLEVAHDNLKSTQSQLIQSEKMASLGELTAGIAHEIQNPLNFVNNFSEVNSELTDELEEEIKKGNIEEVISILKDIRENESKISQHGKRAESIVKGMLMHSRGSSGNKEPTDINALCDEYLRLAYHGFRAKDKSFNADYKLELDESLPKIDVVPQDIGRVLLNLINNAFYEVAKKAKNPQPPEGGAEDNPYKPLVTVSTSFSKSPSGDLGVKINVQDNGPGIPEKIKEKIFQPFFTTKLTGEGTGLGLSISYDIITKGHGGDLKVETTEGKGTDFIISIPVKK